jgi:hypothetical protein
MMAIRNTPRLCGFVAVAALAGGGFSAASAKTYGFVATYLYHDINDKDPKACPTGMNQSLAELFVANASAAERTYYANPDHAKELVFGKPSLNERGNVVCLDPDGPLKPELRPPFKVVQGNGPAFGINLDGRVSPKNFQSLDGKPGVENEFYRVMGCTAGFRPGGILPEGGYGSEMSNGSWTFAFEIDDAENLENDDDVTVLMFSSQDPAPFTSERVPIPNRSLSITNDRRYWSRAKGKIVNGVLKTEPTDVRFLISATKGRENSPDAVKQNGRDVLLRGGRLELNLRLDGTAEGALAGYNDLATFEHSFINYGGSMTGASGSSFVERYSCPSLKRALLDHADGYPDPNTGKFTAISAAFHIKAVPAFIIKAGEGSGVTTTLEWSEPVQSGPAGGRK